MKIIPYFLCFGKWHAKKGFANDRNDAVLPFVFEMWTKRGQKRKTERKKTPELRFGSLKIRSKTFILRDYLLASSIATATATCHMGMTGTAAYCCEGEIDYLDASSIATATATVIPTMGLLPAPIKPIIST